MNYEKLAYQLKPFCPKAKVAIASEFVEGWEGVGLQVQNIMLIAYKMGDDWVVDSHQTDDIEIGPDVYEFEDENDTVRFLLESYKKLSKLADL